MSFLQTLGRMLAKTFLVLACGGGTGLLIYGIVLRPPLTLQHYDSEIRRAEEQRALITGIGGGLLASAAMTLILLVIGWIIRSASSRRERPTVRGRFPDSKPGEHAAFSEPKLD